MSRTPAADDFPSIRARLRELARQPDPPCACAYVVRDGHRLRITAAGCPLHEGWVGSVHEPMAADRWREETEGRP